MTPRLLTRYILKESITLFAVALFAFTGILLTLRMLKLSSLVINKGVEFQQVAQVFLAIVPTFLEIAVPLAALLGVMLTFARLSGDSEIVVMRGSGISIYQLLLPVVLFGILTSALSFWISLSLRPWGFRHLNEALFDIARTKSTAGLVEGVFNKLGALTLYAEEIAPRTGGLRRVLIDDRRDELQRKVVLAQSGRITSDPVHRTITMALADGAIHEITGSEYGLTRFATNSIVLGMHELTDGGDQPRGRTPRELTLAELSQEITRYETALATVDLNGEGDEKQPREPLIAENPQWSPREVARRLVRLKLETGMRFSMPCAALVLSLLALPLGVQPPRAQRTWGIGLSALLGMVVFVLYYGLLSVGSAAAEAGVLPPVVALWLPNVAALGFALTAIQRVASERWQSIAHGIEGITAVTRRFVQRRMAS